jgi:hypothetical protein
VLASALGLCVGRADVDRDAERSVQQHQRNDGATATAVYAALTSVPT